MVENGFDSLVFFLVIYFVIPIEDDFSKNYFLLVSLVKSRSR